MKNIFAHLLTLFLFSFSTIAQNNVTFQVDMNSVDPTTFTTPEVNGTFNGWCGNCAAMSDLDGDNIWDVTIDLANGTYEFKYSADNWTIQESLFSGDSCTNGNTQYTNRMLTVSGDTTLPVVCWSSCSSCNSGPSSYSVTFEVDMRGVADPYTTPEVNGAFNGWCGSCWPMTDADGDSVWQFSANFGVGDSLEWKYSADNWNIQEELDSNLSCITINYDPSAPNGWGFVNRLAVVNSDTAFSSSWNNCYVSGINGCTDSTALNYNPLATIDDSSCVYCYYGCMDILACNYDSLATCDDGSCLTTYGCTDSLACNFDPLATCDDGSCLTLYGCTDSLACNFAPLATCDDGSCLTIYGCMNPSALNYDSLANCPDSCVFPQVTYGCTDSTALNYNPLATIDDSSCVYCYYGCTDSLACNFDPLATCDDGSCLTTYGCTDSLACNFDPLATCDDGSCLNIYGCTDSLANNYDPLATCDDSTCVYGYSVTFQLDLRGVTNITYINPEVNGVFNGWCGSCTQLEDLNNDSIWEITILIDSGSYEYKYSVDNWTIEENLFSGDSCTVSSNGFTNRILHVNQDTILDPVCWESCEDCLSSSGPSSYNVTFRLDMSDYVGPPFTTPEVNGTFNNWCGSCWAMTDDNGDNIWEFTALLAAGDTVEYKFSADGWNIQEELDSTGNCITVAFDPGAPNGWGYVNRYLVVGSEIELDAVCWNSCSECQGQTGVSENDLSNVFVYPNPSSGLINIKAPSETSRIDIYSVLGKLVYSKTNTNEHTINIKENGIYYISVYVGNKVISKKITIQN